MPDAVAYVLLLLLAYAVGGVPFALLIGRLNGVDVRNVGSGNIGATNVYRSCGPGWGVACFLADFLKGLLPVLAASYLARAHGWGEPVWAPLPALLGTVLGHIFTPYLGFRGGKGIATSAGAVCGVAPWAVLTALLAWVLVLKLTKWVSLASIVGAAILPLAALGQGLVTTPVPGPTVGLLFVLGGLAIARHHANIRRLLAGTEPKVGRPQQAVTSLDPDDGTNHRDSEKQEANQA